MIDEDRFVKRLQSEDHSEKLSKSLTSETQDQQAAILRSSFVKSSSQSNRIHSFTLFFIFLFFQCEFDFVLAARNQLDEEQIRNWLNYKFPQGFSQLEQSLENVDEDQTGFVRRFNDTFQYKTKTIFFKKKRFAKKIFSMN